MTTLFENRKKDAFALSYTFSRILVAQCLKYVKLRAHN